MPYTHTGPWLYLAADQQTIVEAGDPRAAYLLVAEGGTLPDDVAKRHGLPRLVAQVEQPEGERAPAQDDESEQSEGEKAAQPKPNKARTPRENKAG